MLLSWAVLKDCANFGRLWVENCQSMDLFHDTSLFNTSTFCLWIYNDWGLGLKGLIKLKGWIEISRWAGAAGTDDHSAFVDVWSLRPPEVVQASTKHGQKWFNRDTWGNGSLSLLRILLLDSEIQEWYEVVPGRSKTPEDHSESIRLESRHQARRSGKGSVFEELLTWKQEQAKSIRLLSFKLPRGWFSKEKFAIGSSEGSSQ